MKREYSKNFSDLDTRFFDFETVIFHTREDAESVHATMLMKLYEYGYVTVMDFFNLANLPIQTCEASWYGWKNLDASTIIITDKGYSIKLPTPTLVNVGADEHEIKRDLVNHPSHYISESGLEVIDVIKAFTDDLEGMESYLTGNIIKYICRWKHKGGLQDLEKARWYIDYLINYTNEKESMNEEE